MRMMRQLGREDWVLAGVEVLAAAGARGFRVEPVARRLGVTKGSFYWHFADRGAWRDAVLGYWEHRAFAAMLGRVPRGPAAGLDWASVRRALQDWGREDAAVARCLDRVAREAARAPAAAQAKIPPDPGSNPASGPARRPLPAPIRPVRGLPCGCEG